MEKSIYPFYQVNKCNYESGIEKNFPFTLDIFVWVLEVFLFVFFLLYVILSCTHFCAKEVSVEALRSWEGTDSDVQRCQ